MNLMDLIGVETFTDVFVFLGVCFTLAAVGSNFRLFTIKRLKNEAHGSGAQAGGLRKEER